jgi:hypothetical protein
MEGKDEMAPKGIFKIPPGGFTLAVSDEYASSLTPDTEAVLEITMQVLPERILNLSISEHFWEQITRL